MCMMDLDYCEVWDERPVVARKPHYCDGCGGLIAAKAEYVRHFSKFEGSITTGKLCAECKADRQKFADAHEGMLCAPPAFRSMLNDCIAEGDQESEEMWKPMLAAMDARNDAAPDRI